MIDNSKYLQRAATMLLLCAAGLGLFLNIDPSGSGFGSATVAPIKYAPYLVSYITIPFFLLSRKYNRNRMLVVILLFVAIMIAGSCYAFLVLHQPLEDTYLGRALGGGICIAYFLLAGNRRELQYFLPRLGRILLIAALLMSAVLLLFRLHILYPGLPQIYHVDVIFIACSLILASIFVKKTWKRRALQMIFIAAMLLEAKTTAYLSLVVALTFLTLSKHHAWYKGGLDKAAKLRRSLVLIFVTVMILAVSAGVMKFVITTRLDQSEDKVRTYTAGLRFQQFLDSPIVGSLFTDSPVIKVSSLVIPAHSDLLDMLAFGGVLSVVLFFVPIVILFFKNGNQDLDDMQRKVYLLAKFILIEALLIMCVNPMLAQPRLAFIFWGAIGLVLALQNPSSYGISRIADER